MSSSSHKPFRIRPERPSRLRQAMSFVATIVITIILAVTLNQFVFQSFFVDGESMSPTLHSGDRLIVSRIERTFSTLLKGSYVPQRGQIVVINGEASPSTSERAPELIKRVIGLPGETIHIEKNIVTITNHQGSFNADERLGLSLDGTYVSQPIHMVIPDDSVFVIGDNRAPGGSLDSRSFGPVKTKFIDGRLFMRIMPFTQLRVF